MRHWRGALAVFALQVCTTGMLYAFFVVVLPWATAHLGEPWTFSRIDT
jgi:hypothetical protein